MPQLPDIIRGGLLSVFDRLAAELKQINELARELMGAPV
jgi:hypothetical protein